MSRVGRMLATVLIVPAVLAGAWVVGFGCFLYVATRPPPPLSPANGIVAFTGGAGRVSTALKLLSEGYGSALLVSGVNRSAGFQALAQRAGADETLASRVTLGREASDTHGNALETAEWARRNDIRSLIVVTAGYHMPRALAELSRTMPNVRFYPFPVLSPILRGHLSLEELQLLAGEYTKWLVTEAGLSSLAGRTRNHDHPIPPQPVISAGQLHPSG